MQQPPLTTTICLTHQLNEDQSSPVGLVCRQCKQRLYTQPPSGTCRSFWESQPAAYSLDQQPCFVYSLMWEDFRIRSLHPPQSNEDSRGQRANATTTQTKAAKDQPPAWVEDFRIDPDWPDDFEIG